jgi:hypothetical protein
MGFGPGVAGTGPGRVVRFMGGAGDFLGAELADVPIGDAPSVAARLRKPAFAAGAGAPFAPAPLSSRLTYTPGAPPTTHLNFFSGSAGLRAALCEILHQFREAEA